jgi:hypothetical protein
VAELGCCHGHWLGVQHDLWDPEGRSEPVRTYVQASTYHLYIACGAGFLLVGLALPALKVYSYEAITVLIAVISGVLFFVMGGTLDWPELRWFGLLWWAGASGCH